MISETSMTARPAGEGWCERSGIFRIFRACHLALSPALLVPAFLGVVTTFMIGYTMDWIWPKSASPIVVVGSGESELDHYVHYTQQSEHSQGEPRAAVGTRIWTNEHVKSGSGLRIGVFELMVQQKRRFANALIGSVLALNPSGVLEAINIDLSSKAWMFSMHWVYGTLFSLLMLVVWGFFGGAICRAAALRIARDEPASMWEALGYARTRLLSFTAAPLVPIAFALLMLAMLWLMGVVGAIPWLGDVVVGLLFIIPILLGMGAAMFAIGGFLIYPLFSPGIAADDVDPGEAFANAGQFLTERPGKYFGCMLLALVYGAIVLLLMKLFVTLVLWMTAAGLGASMNWGDALTTTTGSQHVDDKLTAMWQPPRPVDNRPFYGTFDRTDLRSRSWFAQRCIRAWIFVLWGVVAAFAIAFFYAASTIVYFIMRRDVNETDMEDVYLERAESGTTSSPAQAT